ncbi:hypothetical protein SCUP234_11743 [Seiridium cupressi]
MGLTSPLSRYRLYWRLLGAALAILLLHHVLCLRNTFGVQQTDDYLNPIKKVFRPRPPVCAQLEGIEDIFVVLKTGAAESREKLPVHFATTLQCVPNYAVYSDLEETVAGHHIYDALDEVNPDIVASHPDFVYYQKVKKDGRTAFTDEEVEQWNHAQNTMFGRDSPGWRLDKWKFLPLAEKALKQSPGAKWFVFMETDTYIMWSQLLLWLSHFWEQYPYYLGVQMQIGDDVFAYGGAGFVLSNTALRMIVKQYRLKKKHYDEVTADHWAGDCVLGMVAADAGVQLQWSWPNLYGEQPNNMNFNDDFGGEDGHLWCHYASSFHHMTPYDMIQFNEFESTWRTMNGRTLRYKDVFRQYIVPQLSPLKADWDNLSEDVQDEKSSLEECRSMCEADEGCVQFSIVGETCSTSKIVKLGRRSTEAPMQANSGWMMERVNRFMEAMDASCWEQTWIQPCQMSERPLPPAWAAGAGMQGKPLAGASASTEEWARHRPIIARLYHDENRKLEDVMEIMATRYSFQATKRMYKKKICDWAISKKLKEDDVLQILCICTFRNRQDLPVSFSVRGKRIHESRLRRYIDRNPRVMKRFHQGAAPAAESVQAVTYRTFSLLDNWENQSEDDRSHSLEQLLWSMRLYIQGCFDTAVWAHDGIGCWSAKSTPKKNLELHDAWHLPFVGIIGAMMQKDGSGNLNDHLNQYFDNLSPLVKAHPPFLLAALIGMLFRLQQVQQHRISTILLRHVIDLSTIYHGAEHGLSRVVQYLYNLITTYGSDVYWFERSLDLVVGHFENQTGEENAISTFLSTIQMAVSVLGRGLVQNWTKAMTRHARALTRDFPDIGSAMDKTDGDPWNLGYLMDERFPPAARKILQAAQFEPPIDSEDAGWQGPSWRTNAMVLAKRHYRFHMSPAMIVPGVFPVVMDYFNVVSKAICT